MEWRQLLLVESFERKLREFARLLVEVGLNVQPGQTPVILSSTEAAPLARLCVEACYDCGARNVLVDWDDDFVTRQKYLRAEDSVFQTYPSYAAAKTDWLMETGCPRLSFAGSDPELLKGVDPSRMQNWRRVAGAATLEYSKALKANRFQWCVGSYPSPAWAEKMFPGKRGQEAIDALWDAIFSVCRINGDGKGVDRWKEHIETTARRCETLNRYAFKTLRYRNSLGTDLEVQLPENHVWLGGSECSAAGVPFVANIPTEEIFTAPRWDGVNGRVYSAMPLSLGGNLVDHFWMDFKDGRIVDLHAEQGEEHLRSSVDLDEGSHYLGEVALVPYDSPIRNTGLLFWNTLFDENASCHLAFGSAYPTCVKNGDALSDEEQKKAGLNQSINHVDFMVGTADLSITGVQADGTEVPVFVDGNFAF